MMCRASDGLCTPGDGLFQCLFDVAFLRKPVVYYQFDEEEFRKYHYQKGYFDFRRDGLDRYVRHRKRCWGLTESFEMAWRCRQNTCSVQSGFSRCMTEITAGGRLKRLQG
ncbi:MAG: hypothetical protein ACLURV_03080 [Gallintestinimicrobium sp.]